MLLRFANTSDLPEIAALERLPESHLYVGQWTDAQHARAMSGLDARYLVYDEGGHIQAYLILRGFEYGGASIELKRLVVGEPGRGVGRQILSEVLRLVFEEFKAHRLFLDVFEDNARALHLYRSLGFVEEGVMREATERDGKWMNLVLMSLLNREYSAKH